MPDLRQALEHLPDAVEVVDREGRFLWVNAAFERLLGFRRDEVVGEAAAGLLRGGTPPPSFYEAVWAGLMEGRRWSGVLESRRKDGTLVALEVAVTPVRDTSGQVTHVVGIRRDITHRLRAEEATRESEARWRSVFDRNPAVKLLIDPDTGCIIRANEEAAAFYGWSVAELSRMRIWEINTLPEADVRAEMAAARAENRRHFRFVHRLRSGELRRIEVFTGPIKFGPRTLLLSIIHDVTAREVARERLVASEARLAALLSRLPVGVAVRQGGVLAIVNRTFARMMGRSVEELTGVDPLSLVAPVDRDELLRRMDEAERRGEAPLVEVERDLARIDLLRRGGEVLAAEVHTIAFDLDGATASMLVVIDASERERLTARLHRTHRMDSLGRVAGGLAHDFNNLLFVVLNGLQLLRKEVVAGNDAAAVADHLERVEAAAQRAVDLVRQLLLLSRSSDGAEPAAERVDASAAVRDLIALLRATLAPAVRLELDLATGCEARIARASLDQLIVNLAANASDAMPDGGRLLVRTRRVEGDGEEAATLAAGPRVELVVEDEGSGMTREVLDRAFEPFFTTKEHGRGTGLGLSIVVGVVERAGGSVSVRSEPGQGTSVRVLLPWTGPEIEGSRDAAAGEAEAVPVAAPVTPPATTVLVVDDHPAVLAVLERILCEAGYRVLGADGPIAALSLLGPFEGEVDLLLTDVLMPHMSGPELATAVLAARPAVAVVFMSGHPGDALARGSIDAAELLEKPFSAEQLLEHLRRVLASRR